VTFGGQPGKINFVDDGGQLSRNNIFEVARWIRFSEQLGKVIWWTPLCEYCDVF
jgi:hypothetical protein